MRILLTEFRIRNFRCIDDSGWIKLEDITALVGVNESGKTAILQALRTLKPGNQIINVEKIRDFPRSRLASEYKDDSIVAQGKFLIPLEYIKSKGIINNFNFQEGTDVYLTLTRRYNKQLEFKFDIDLAKEYIENIKEHLKGTRANINRKKIIKILEERTDNIEENKKKNEEVVNADAELIFTEEVQNEIINVIDDFKNQFSDSFTSNLMLEDSINRINLAEIIDNLNKNLGKYFNIAKEELKDLLDYLEDIIPELKNKSESERLYEAIKGDLPVFIYFEDYQILGGSIDISNLVKAIQGNVDYKESQIQKTLFQHVNLDPIEIYKLGPRYLTPQKEGELQQRISNRNISAKQVTEEFYAKVSKDKKIQLQERKILLDSASQLMTKTLNQYFQERKYKVEYDTDGQFLQILIWDEKRPSKINLEDRSKGFRWYFSFFLVFLVESGEMHRNAILLLDEPGIHLHLQAQFNLINFFQKLKETNQIIYTTHSPFLIDENHLEQVRSVYEDENGITHITDNNLIPDKKSIFPLQAALSYKTSQVIYQGLKQLLVEGDSDYNYIKAISSMLTKLGKKSLDKDIVIVPCKSASKIEMYARLFRDLENIPVVLLDSDEEGKKAYENLFDSLFAEYKRNLLMIGDFLSNKKNVEIEDLIGKKILAEIINKNNITDSLVSENDIGEGPFVDSLVAYCNKNNVKFKQKDGWKYQLSLKFKNEIYELDKNTISNKFPENQIQVFEKLIEKINKYARKKVKD